MSSSQDYPAMQTGTIDPSHMAGSDITVNNEWSFHNDYAFNNDALPYATPYPSSTVESQPWTQYARSSVPDIQLNTYGLHPQQPQAATPDIKDIGRPRSSPSTFRPSADALPWSTGNGLGIQYTTAGGHPTPPVTSTFPPNVFSTFADDSYGNSSPPELRQPKRPYPTIAPNPQGIAAKRKREDEDQSDANAAARGKRKRTSSVASTDLKEEDSFLVQLKEEENLPWKDIAMRFQTDKVKQYSVATLQMRYKRLRDKYRVWEEQDIRALKLAHEYWEKMKWEIIAGKMIEFGAPEKWPAKYCSRKWQELNAASQQQQTLQQHHQHQAAISGPYSSPVQNVMAMRSPPMAVTTGTTTPHQYAFMPNFHHHHQNAQQQQ